MQSAAETIATSHPRKHLRLHLLSYAFLFSLLSFSAQAHPQAIATGPSGDGGSAAASTNDSGPKGIVPAHQGFNASLGTTAQHDSSSGWATILTPGIAYRFNNAFSVNFSIPIYADIQVQANTGTKGHPVYTSVTKHGVPGDASIAAQVATAASLVDYTATFSVGLPSGNTAYGLGSGKASFDFNNHIEKSIGVFTPDFEVGIGNSNSLIGRRVRKNYTSTGALAHFQAGTSIDLPANMSFDAEAYEELPLNASTIYSVTGPGRKKNGQKAATTNSAEDNGFTMSLDVPAGSHITFSGFFNRSVRTDDNIAGLSATFILRPSGESGGTQ